MNEPPKFHITFYGFSVGAQGVLGILAVLLVLSLLLYFPWLLHS